VVAYISEEVVWVPFNFEDMSSVVDEGNYIRESIEEEFDGVEICCYTA
jgi:hypothetical protein